MTDTPNTDVLAARALPRQLAYAFCGKLRQSQKSDVSERLGIKLDYSLPTLERDKRFLRAVVEADAVGILEAAVSSFLPDEFATPQSDGTAIPAGDGGKFFEAVKRYSYPAGTEVVVRIHETGWDVYDPITCPPSSFATAPTVASDTMREAIAAMIRDHFAGAFFREEWLENGHRQTQEHDACQEVDELAGCIAALSVQSPANAGQDGDLLEQAARVAENMMPPSANNGRIAAAIRALNPTKDAQS